MTNQTLTHASLFSGIGGFDLAASLAGIENIFQVEIDEFCRAVLNKNFPHTIQYSDIKEFNGAEYNGAIDIISGGFPCQPFSVAGKRKGVEDDRYLWGEMLRVIKEIEPTFVVAENVPGLLTIDDGMVFEQCCLDLEATGYEVQAFIIPALAVGAPHRRDRVWITAYSESLRAKRRDYSRFEIIDKRSILQDKFRRRRLGGQIKRRYRIATDETTNAHNSRNRTSANDVNEKLSEGREKWEQPLSQSCGYCQNIANADSCMPQKFSTRQGEIKPRGGSWRTHWYEAATALCRVDDGVPTRMDRAKRIKALGNAIVPQIAYQIFKSIILSA